jgi:hypothetical protein
MNRFFLVLCLPALLFAQDIDWWDNSKAEFSISTAEQLKGVAKLVNDGTTNFMGKTISLSNDIVLTEDFIPIGKDSISLIRMFRGTFDGNGHSISGLSVENQRSAGLFGFAATVRIRNLTINASKIKASGSGRVYAGVLAGFFYGAIIKNCYVTADSIVANGSDISLSGGLAGFIRGDTISNSHFVGNVLATGKAAYSGGLTGAAALTAIDHSYFTGNVSAMGTDQSTASGLVSYAGDISYTGDKITDLVMDSRIKIFNSYSKGDVTATAPNAATASGLVGTVIGGTEISKSYSIGNISAKCNTSLAISSGLVGMILPMYGGPLTVSNSYSIGDISAISRDYLSISGGLVGYTYGSTTNITNSYVSGEISGTDHVGGIFGRYSNGTVRSTYYNSEGASQASGDGGSPAGIEAKGMNELKMKNTFVGWDFNDIWEIEENSTTPFLNFWRSISNDIEYFKILDQTYNGSQIKPQPIIQKKDGTPLLKNVDYELSYGENKNAGEGTVTVTGKNTYSSISKIIVFNILPKGLTFPAAAAENKTYDGTDIAIITGITLRGVISGDDVSLLNFATGTFESANAANNTYIPVSTNMYLTGESAANYFVIQPADLKARIYQKGLASDAIEPIEDQDYTGVAIEPVIVVKDNTNVLVLGTDYTITYSNNIMGTATVTANGINNYSGRATANFTIIGGNLSSSSVESSSSSSSLTLSSSNNISSSSSLENISSSSDDGYTQILFSKTVNMNSIVAIKNAINLQVQNSARLDIHNINGKLEKTLYLKSGVYNVSLKDLPKGMYIVKTMFGNEKRILKVPVM